MIESFEHTPQQQMWMTSTVVDVAQYLRRRGVLSNRNRARIAAVLQSMYNNGVPDALISEIQTTMFQLPTEILVDIPPEEKDSRDPTD